MLGARCRQVSRNAGRNACGGAELGGRDHIGIDAENQIALWAAEQFGFPPSVGHLPDRNIEDQSIPARSSELSIT